MSPSSRSVTWPWVLVLVLAFVLAIAGAFVTGLWVGSEQPPLPGLAVAEVSAIRA